MLFAILTFAAFADILIVVCVSSSQPNLPIAVYGLDNGIFRPENTPTKGNLMGTEGSTLSI
jgi:hypothetical protein